MFGNEVGDRFAFIFIYCKIKKIDVKWKKVEFDNSVIVCVKDDKMLITLKKWLVLGVLKREERWQIQ